MGGSDGTLVCRSLDCRKSRAGGGCHRAAQYAPFILPLTAVACSAIFPRLYGIVAGLAVLVLSCFVSASLPHMSICSGIVIAISFKQVDNAPYAKPCSKCDHKYLQSVDCRCKKFHNNCRGQISGHRFIAVLVLPQFPNKKTAAPAKATAVKTVMKFSPSPFLFWFWFMG